MKEETVFSEAGSKVTLQMHTRELGKLYNVYNVSLKAIMSSVKCLINQFDQDQYEKIGFHLISVHLIF